MFSKLIVILLCMGMYHAQGEEKVTAANAETIESRYFIEHSMQDTAGLKSQIWSKQPENDEKNILVRIKVGPILKDKSEKTNSITISIDDTKTLILNCKLAKIDKKTKKAIDMKGIGRDVYQTVYILNIENNRVYRCDTSSIQFTVRRDYWPDLMGLL